MKPAYMLLIGLAGAAVAVLANQQVGWDTNSSIVGRWTCKARYNNADIQSEMYFAREGDLRATVWVRASAQGHSFAAKMQTEGEWRVRKETLRANYGKRELVSASGDGKQLPMTELRSYVEKDYFSIAHHTIESLTDNAMTYQAGVGRVKCER